MNCEIAPTHLQSLPIVFKQGCFPFKRAISLIRSILQSVSWCAAGETEMGKHVHLCFGDCQYGTSRCCFRWGNTWRTSSSHKVCGLVVRRERCSGGWESHNWQKKKYAPNHFAPTSGDLLSFPEFNLRHSNFEWNIHTASYYSLSPLPKFHGL